MRTVFLRISATILIILACALALAAMPNENSVYTFHVFSTKN